MRPGLAVRGLLAVVGSTRRSSSPRLRAHELNANVIPLVVLVQLGLAVAVWRPGRRP